MDNFKILKLKIENFRNLENDIVEFSKNINCIFGDNGNGKTNLLEAIHYLFKRKSFRKNTSFPQFLSIDSEKPEIIFSSVIEINGNMAPLSGKITEKNSDWYLDSQKTKRKIEAPVVFINPFDSYEFHKTASMRRTWFDNQISQIDKEYKKYLSSYNQMLRQRNTLLKKKPSYYRDQIVAIDTQRISVIKNIVEKRNEFLKQLNPICSPVFKEIFSEEHQLEIFLESEFNNLNEEKILKIIGSQIEKEEILGFTQSGIHKDDYTLLFDGINSFEYCSLGQQKMSYISLLFAYIELFRYKFESFPIVLIDDVSGELDGKRWSNLVSFLDNSMFQVFITTANENFKKELEKMANVENIFVNSGLIEKI